MLNAMAMMAVPWKPPRPLPEDKENPPVQVISNELAVQANRMSMVPAVSYLSENEVPISPKLISDVERALELSSLITSAPKIIPFFTPHEASSAPPNEMVLNSMNLPNVAPAFPSVSIASSSSEATIETVLAMGLPLYLVGSNIQALQTLAATPDLLNTFRDTSGVYDQPRLMNFVQTLTQNLAPQSSQSQHQILGYNAVNSLQNNLSYYQPTSASFTQSGQAYGLANAYAAPSLNNQLPQQQQLQQQPVRGYRGDQNIGEANLHLSGYGPTTTNDDIVAMFAPYVHVVEVVQKNGFCFVNTRDPEGARRAREALTGSLLGGCPVRINVATRKMKNPARETNTVKSSSVSNFASLPNNNLGQIDFDQVRPSSNSENLLPNMQLLLVW